MACGLCTAAQGIYCRLLGHVAGTAPRSLRFAWVATCLSVGGHITHFSMAPACRSVAPLTLPWQNSRRNQPRILLLSSAARVALCESVRRPKQAGLSRATVNRLERMQRLLSMKLAVGLSFCRAEHELGARCSLGRTGNERHAINLRDLAAIDTMWIPAYEEHPLPWRRCLQANRGPGYWAVATNFQNTRFAKKNAEQLSRPKSNREV